MSKSVYEVLREDIISGNLPPGSPLIETNLAQLYGVSRTPIREALLKLRQDDLIDYEARRLRVRSRSPEEILEIYEAGIILEGAAARLAANRRTAFDLSRIEASYQDMERSDPENSQLMADLSRIFHEQIWRASHNGTLMDLLERVNAQLHRYPESNFDYPGRSKDVLSAHEDIVNAIRDGRADDADRLASLHMQEARDVRLKMFAQTDDRGSLPVSS